jgi:ABC-type transporter Mla subunit MlaD
MERQQLKATLKRIHAELESTGSADPELKELLGELDDDIHRLTQQQDQASASFGERLEAAALGFEAEHPRVSMLLKELSDSLAKLGL